MVNVSAENITVDEQGILRTPHTSWIILLVLIVICFTTILSNLAVIASFILEPRLREPFGYYLFNLAGSDLITGIFGMTHLIEYTRYTYWPFGYKRCTFWLYVDWLGTTVSLVTLTIISLDRLWATIKPISYHRYNTTRKAFFIITLSWICVNASILPGQGYDRLYHGEHYYKYDCYWDFSGPTVWASPLYVVPLTEWIPVLLVIFCYVIITIKICQRSRHRGGQVGDPSEGVTGSRLKPTSERRRLKEKQAYLLLSLLFVALVLCWGPWFVYSGLSTYTGYYDWMVYMVTYWMGYSMSMFNPFLFNVANKDMRQAVRRLLRCGKVKSSIVTLPIWITNQDGQLQPSMARRGTGLEASSPPAAKDSENSPNFVYEV